MSNLAQAVMLLMCIWEMLYSNIGCNANYSEGAVSVIFLSLQEEVRTAP
jgi:hypothetical protein